MHGKRPGFCSGQSLLSDVVCGRLLARLNESQEDGDKGDRVIRVIGGLRWGAPLRFSRIIIMYLYTPLYFSKHGLVPPERNFLKTLVIKVSSSDAIMDRYLYGCPPSPGAYYNVLPLLTNIAYMFFYK